MTRFRDEYWILVRDLDTGKVSRMIPLASTIEGYAEAIPGAENAPRHGAQPGCAQGAP